MTLYVNCSKIYERVIQTLDKQYLAGNYLNLYIGQRNSQSAHFRVSQISLFTFEPRHMISNNVVFLQEYTQTSLCSFLLSSETPDDDQSVA